QKAWLLDYQGLNYSYALNEKHQRKWATEPLEYKNEDFEEKINMVGRKPNRLIIEFDDEPSWKAKRNLNKVYDKLKKKKIGFIRSSHEGKSDYLWVEFIRALTTEEGKLFLDFISPAGATVDLNFTSGKKLFPVLFGKHWKHSTNYEEPVEFYEGEQIDFDKLKIKKKKVATKTINKEGFEYEVLEKITPDVIDKFKDKSLLELIQEELTKRHLGDNNLKMTAFLTAVSGLSANDKLRMSLAIKGNTSTGKDNLIATILSHIPKKEWIFLTSGTQATIEDDIKDIPILAFSEVNANREAGANKYLVEIIKQKAEGGTSSIKKDKRADNKEARHDKGKQATVFFGTTESDKDEELGTRFIEGSIGLDVKKIKRVNDNTLDSFSDYDKLLEAGQE
ncbi:unnamed protein product, partial [marine sediment metagenome]